MIWCGWIADGTVGQPSALRAPTIRGGLQYSVVQHLGIPYLGIPLKSINLEFQTYMSIYLFLKVTHLITIFLFLTATSVTFFSEKDSVSFKIVAGVSGMVVLISGLGLVLIVGREVPFWVLAKFIIWLVLTGGGALVAKRFLKLRVPAYIILLLLASSAAFLAIFKPIL